VEAVKITKVKCIQCGEWLTPSERRCSRCGVDQIAAEENAIFSDLVTAYETAGEARDWFADGAIEGSPLTVIAGPEKWGKSWTLMDLAVSAVTGSRWLGAFEVKRTGEPWYFDCEYGEHEFARRIARIARAKGIDPRDVLPRIRHVWSPGFQLSTENGLCRRSFELAKRTKPNLVVMDPWRDIIVGDENSALDTIEGMRVAAIFREHAGCPVVIAHHLNREGTPSGSRSLKGRADLYFAGTDEEQPWFTTIGRTIRHSDPIAKRFTIPIEHTDDDDNTIATTRLGLRFEGDTVAKHSITKSATRVIDVLRRSHAPMTCGAIREALHMNGPTATTALYELRDAGLVQVRNSKWSASTASVFERLAEDAANAPKVELSEPKPIVQDVATEGFRRPPRRHTR
jgi:hypothetical protein